MTLLLDELGSLIETARDRVATTVNTELVVLYWSVGKRVREHVLGGERARYGAEIVKRVAAQLTQRYGRGFTWSNLFRMMQFAEMYPDPEIFATVSQILAWSHMVEILRIDNAAAGIGAEIAALREQGTATAGLTFRNPYVLDFLGLPPKRSRHHSNELPLRSAPRSP